MKHKVSKFKIKGGVDANQMLLKKLVRNFVAHGKLTTTATKAKYLVATLQKLVAKAKLNDKASLNVLMPYFAYPIDAVKFVSQVQSVVGDKPASGSVTVAKLGKRIGDAASMVKVTWTHALPVAAEAPAAPAPKKSAKTTKKEAPVTDEAQVATTQ